MAPQYKLTYFNVKGMAEPIRMLFAYLDIPYEDVRIVPEQWPELKETTPFGKVPTLEFEGKILSQSLAIMRYLAKKHKLTGKDDWDALQCDILVDVLGDLLFDVKMWHYGQDVEKKQELETKLVNETMPYYLSKLEKLTAEHDGHLVTSTITWADIYIVTILDGMKNKFKLLEDDKYPGLKKLQEKIFAVPAVAEWVAKRPVTEF